VEKVKVMVEEKAGEEKAAETAETAEVDLVEKVVVEME
jgi:hypothetical protein